jgi:hypothetical protein
MRRLVPIIVLFAAVPAVAQPPAAVKKLTVTAAAEPTPALKFTLLPSLMDRGPGNAALEYHRAFAAFPSGLSAADRSKAEEKATEWLKDSPDKAPPAEVRRLLDDFGGAFRHADRAARSDRCDWELDTRVRTDILGTMNHEIGPMRDLGRYVAWRTRSEVAAGRYDDAAQSLRTGFQIARHTGEVPMLIHLLVAASIAQEQLESIEAWVARPGSPNLYWALSGLPRPFVDLRRSVEAEAGFPDTIHWLGLKPLEQGPVSKEQAEKVVGGWVRNVIKSATPEELKQFGLEGPVGDVAVATVLTLRYAAAKKYLLAHGRVAKDLDAMPAAQVVYLYDLALFRELRDDQFKWFALPYPEAHAGLRKAAEHRQKVLEANWNAPVLKTLALSLPALDRVHFAGTRTDRAIAALRVIEAVRMHASANDGKLPSRLDLVKLVPVPNDPVTGQPFGYEVRENTFVLTGPAPAGQAANPGNTLTYEVMVK